MLTSSFLLFASLSAAAVLPQRRTNDTASCTNPKTRVEWRSLTSEERKSYTDAVLCLKTKPSRIGLETSLYDDFPYVHQQLNEEIHFVASFLPWHRYFVQLYEDALKECGYTGSATYWDWSIDVANGIPNSPIWDATTGIGGNGSPDRTEFFSDYTRKCVADGPFADLRLSYFGDSRVEHCLTRSWNSGSEEVGDMLAANYGPAALEPIQALGDYNVYRQRLEGTPHGAVHAATGGEMIPATSPNDPLFFLHHTQIDRLWWLWQQQNPEVRNSEYSGIRTQDQFNGVTPPPASKTDLLPMRGLAPDLAVEEFLTTENKNVCYRY